MKRRFRPIVLVFVFSIIGMTVAATSQAQTISFYSLIDKIGSGLQTGSCTARLNDNQHGGISVRIASADSNLVLIAAAENTPGSAFIDVFVPQGNTDVIFFIQALEDTVGVVDLTATAPGFTELTDTVEVLVPSLKIGGLTPSLGPFDPLDAFYVQVGLANAGNTNLSPAQKVRVGGPGLTATITSSDAVVGELVTTVLTSQIVSVAIAPGESHSALTVAQGGVALDALSAGSLEINATIASFLPVNSIPMTVTVTPPEIIWSGLPTELGSGLQENIKRVRLSGSAHGGLTIHLAVSDSTSILVAPNSTTPGSAALDLFVPDGQTDALFTVQALEGITGAFNITASAPGFATGFTAVTVTLPFFRLTGLGISIDTLDPVDPFVVLVGLPNASFTSISPSQQARAGGPGLTATIISSDASVGLLETSTTLSDTAVVQIAPGQSSSPSSVITDGMAFDGVGVGTALVAATIPGFVPVSAGQVEVVVSQPALSLSSFQLTVGAGLRSGQNSANLGASQHGGVTVHIESLDPAVALVSSNANSMGTSSIDVFVANGQAQAFFWTHGLEDLAGSAAIMATSPLFLSSSNTVQIVEPGVKLNGLNSTMDTIDQPDPFYLTIGYPNPGFTNISSQVVRPGSPGFAIDLVLDDPVVGQLETLSAIGDSVTVTIPAGFANSPTTLAAGGVEFDGLSTGVVQVAAQSLRVVPISGAIRSVTVTSPTIAVSMGATVGAGLQQSGWVTLSAPNHGGVTVHIESMNPAVLLVADGNLNAGQTAVDIPVPNGTSGFNFWVQGVDDMTGSVVVQVSSPQFITQTVAVEIVQPGVELVSLGASANVSAVPDEFYARVGIPSSDHSTVQQGATQERRGGAPPLVVTLVSSIGAVAELVNSTANNDTLTVSIAAGSKTSPTSIALAGVGLVGLTSGQTLVSAVIPGFIQTGDAQLIVEVTNQTIVLNGLTTRLGAGLQSVAVAAELGESGHGGVTVHIEVSDPSLALVSVNALVVGSGSVDIPLSNGEVEAIFYLQALDAAAGNTVSVVASVSGFSDKSQTVEIVAPGTAIVLLADSMNVNVDDDEFVIQIGAVNEDGTGIFEPQAIRGGGEARTITVISGIESFALIETSTTSDDTATVTLNPGEMQTPDTVATGGVAFNPVLAGEVVVTASSPGFTTTGAGMPTILVTGEVVGVADLFGPIYLLRQNVPNPFNPRTKIAFSLARSGPVILKIYDVAGRVVRTLHDGEVLMSGAHETVWAGRNDFGGAVAAGVYLYRLETADYRAVKRMTLIK